MGQEQEPGNAGQRRRQRRNNQEWIKPGLEVHDDQEVHQQNGECQPTQQADIGLPHGLTLAAQNEVRTARQIFLMPLDDGLHGPRDRAQVGSVYVGVDVEHRLDVVVAHRAQFRTWDDGRQIAQHVDRQRRAWRSGGWSARHDGARGSHSAGGCGRCGLR